MSFYFQLQPQGVGTAQVECLSSYLHRMAEAHGAHYYRFMDHLRTWGRCRPGRSLSRHDSIRYNGYSREVGFLLDSLKAGTGLDCLPGCTLIALQKVCAGNAVGALKGTRAWCVACYQEAERNSGIVYDHLYWQLQGISRCSVHALELSQNCSACGAIQRNNSGKTALSRCERCGESLATFSGGRVAAARHDAIAAQAQALLAYTSSVPGTRFQLAQFGEFTAALLAIYSRQKLVEHFGELFHKRYYTLRLQLVTLLDLAAKINVPVINILTDGACAASQMVMPFDLPPRRVSVSRPHFREEVRERALALMQEAIEKGPPYPTLASILALANIPAGTAFYRCQKAFAAYGELRRKHVADVRSKRERVIIGLSKSAPEMRAFRTERAGHEWLAEKSGASINAVRKVMIAERIRKSLSNRSDTAPRRSAVKKK